MAPTGLGPHMQLCKGVYAPAVRPLSKIDRREAAHSTPGQNVRIAVSSDAPVGAGSVHTTANGPPGDNGSPAPHNDEARPTVVVTASACTAVPSDGVGELVDFGVPVDVAGGVPDGVGGAGPEHGQKR